jgi:hypothetical protein
MSWRQQIPIPKALLTDPETKTWAQQIMSPPPVKTVTTTYTAETTDHTILGDATAATFTISLPKAPPCKGDILILKKIDASGNAVTIDGNGSTIETSSSIDLTARWDSRTVQSDGVNWVILAST